MEDAGLDAFKHFEGRLELHLTEIEDPGNSFKCKFNIRKIWRTLCGTKFVLKKSRMFNQRSHDEINERIFRKIRSSGLFLNNSLSFRSSRIFSRCTSLTGEKDPISKKQIRVLNAH